MAVGRPEGTGCVFGAGKHGGLLGVEWTKPEVGVAFVVDGGEGKRFAVGRDDDWACIETRGAERGLRRRRDVGANRKRRSVGTLRKIEDDDGQREENSSAYRQQARAERGRGRSWRDGGRQRGLRDSLSVAGAHRERTGNVLRDLLPDRRRPDDRKRPE